MKLHIPASAAIGATIGAIAAVCLVVRCYDDRINGFKGVGGREAFERQRAAHLERLRKNEHVTDAVVRERERALLDAEIQDIGKMSPAEEVGGELKIERVER